jgi:hypothetical protein
VSLRHLYLSVLFFPDHTDPNVWVAQALEKDIAATGQGIEGAKRAFERTVGAYFALSAKYQKEPLSTLGPAPDQFWTVWRLVAAEKLAAERIPSVPAFMLPAVSHDAVSAR